MNAPDDDADRPWGNVRFRPVHARGSFSDDAAGARFWAGLGVLLMVALVYPWYSYQVHSYLAARDLEAAGRALVAGFDQASRSMAADAAATRAQSEADSQRRRLAAVQVVGASDRAGQALVLVQLGEARLAEAAATICQQAGRWLRRDVSGETLRIQQMRGAQPALDAGQISCR